MALTEHDRRGARGLPRPDPQGEGAGEEHVRPRPALLDVHPPDRPAPRPSSPASSAHAPDILAANLAALRAGWNFGETTEDFASSVRGRAREDAAGHLPQHHRQHRRSRCGLVAAAHRAGLPLVPRLVPDHPGLRHPARARRSTSGSASRRSRPRTRSPASASPWAPASAAPSASPPRRGPGVALKSETIGLAVTLELPLVIVDVQRGGPSTGLPTKTEQADLLQAMFGRNGEAPVPIVAPQSPADCFDAAMEAVRIATTYRTPVFLLSDGYLANGSEPWRVPDVDEPARPARRVRHRAQRHRRQGRARLPAVPARRGDPGPAVGRPRHRRASSTASAASRRPTAPATSPTTPPTTTR